MVLSVLNLYLCSSTIVTITFLIGCSRLTDFCWFKRETKLTAVGFALRSHHWLTTCFFPSLPSVEHCCVIIFISLHRLGHSVKVGQLKEGTSTAPRCVIFNRHWQYCMFSFTVMRTYTVVLPFCYTIWMNNIFPTHVLDEKDERKTNHYQTLSILPNWFWFGHLPAYFFVWV